MAIFEISLPGFVDGANFLEVEADCPGEAARVGGEKTLKRYMSSSYGLERIAVRLKGKYEWSFYTVEWHVENHGPEQIGDIPPYAPHSYPPFMSGDIRK